jgi:hypothetical protein
MSRLECWCVRCSSSPILMKHLGHWAAGNLVSCQEWKGLIYKFCGVVNILDIPIFSCAMYHMAPKGETKKTCWTWWSLDSRISSWCFNQLEGHSFEVTKLTQEPQPQWASPHGWHRAGWRCTCGGGRFAAGLTYQELVVKGTLMTHTIHDGICSVDAFRYVMIWLSCGWETLNLVPVAPWLLIW